MGDDDPTDGAFWVLMKLWLVTERRFLTNFIFSRWNSVFYDEEKTHSRAKRRRTDEGSTTQKPNGK